MSKSTKLFVTGLCLIATITLSEALTCFHCSSETYRSSDFCNVTLEDKKIPLAIFGAYDLSLSKRCGEMITDNLIPTCRKTVEITVRALECYQCSSETIGSEFCGQVFLPDKIPDTLDKYNISVMRSCNATSEHLIPSCRKTVEEKNGATITKRFCYYTKKSDSVFCNEPHDGSRVFCQDCFTDGCNSAPQVVAQKVGFIIIPLVLSKISLL